MDSNQTAGIENAQSLDAKMLLNVIEDIYRHHTTRVTINADGSQVEYVVPDYIWSQVVSVLNVEETRYSQATRPTGDKEVDTVCNECGGKGYVDHSTWHDPAPDHRTCIACNGSGEYDSKGQAMVEWYKNIEGGNLDEIDKMVEPETSVDDLISEWDISIVKDGGIIARGECDYYNSNLMIKSEVFYPQSGYKLTTEQRDIENVAMSLYKKFKDQIDFIQVQPVHSTNKFPDFIVMYGKMYKLDTPAPTDDSEEA